MSPPLWAFSKDKWQSALFLFSSSAKSVLNERVTLNWTPQLHRTFVKPLGKACITDIPHWHLIMSSNRNFEISPRKWSWALQTWARPDCVNPVRKAQRSRVTRAFCQTVFISGTCCDFPSWQLLTHLITCECLWPPHTPFISLYEWLEMGLITSWRQSRLRDKQCKSIS